MATLSSQQRKALPAKAFVFPAKRSFPIPDKSHARNALARAGAKGPGVQAAVRSKVQAKFPGISVAGKKRLLSALAKNG